MIALAACKIVPMFLASVCFMISGAATSSLFGTPASSAGGGLFGSGATGGGLFGSSTSGTGGGMETVITY